MKKYLIKRTRKWRGVMVLVVLLTALMIVGTVYADDGQNPEDTSEAAVAEESPQPEDGSPSVEESAGEMLDETDLGDVPEQQEGIENSPDESSDMSESGGESLDEIDNDGEGGSESEVEESEAVEDEGESGNDVETIAETATGLAEYDITILNEEGESIDMASQNSLETITSADPWWMVGAVKYAYIKTGGTCPTDTTLGVTCFESATPISSALTYMDFNNLVPTNGILHVEPDSYSESININGAGSNLANLKGLVSDGSSANTEINGDVYISNTLFGFTLSGFTINGKVNFNGVKGTLTLTDLDVTSSTGSGIYVSDQNGAVNVDRVKSDHNINYGMFINNLAGTSSVTVTNSEFSHNESGVPGSFYGGLVISTNGTIKLDGVSANGNYGNGAKLDAKKGITVKNGAFNYNTADLGYGGVGFGLFVSNNYSTNHILLENVQADGNFYHGITLDSGANVTLKNVNTYNNGTSSGSHGINIDNRNGSGTVSITNSTVRDNGAYGLRILSHKNVTINGLTATGNLEDGVVIDNCDFDGGSGLCLGTGSVTISGKNLNIFNNNHGYGLYILSGGSVLLSYFEANHNDYSGVLIKNDYTGRNGSVTIRLSYVPPVGDWKNSMSLNTQNGLLVTSFGNILVDQCTMEGNGSYGASLNNSMAVNNRTVSVKNSQMTANGDVGLYIRSKGNILLQNVDVFKNTSSSGVDISNSSGTGSVTITGSGSTQRDFSGNGTYGLRIFSSGSITLKNINAVANQYGANLNNLTSEGKTVSISNADFSRSTSGNGLAVYSKGAITLSDVISNGNTSGAGANIQNDNAARAQNIKITRSQFSDNKANYGISISSLGTINITGIQANGNYSYGAAIDNCLYDGGIPGCRGIGSIKITGTGNEFNLNGGSGVLMYSRAIISLSNITANENEENGLVIWNNYENATGNINLASTKGETNSFSFNESFGISINSKGNITLSKFNADNNSGNGVYLSNQDAPAGKKVSLSYATINNNQSNGLIIYSTGLVMLTEVQVLRSSKYFWEIQDDDGQYVYDRLPHDQLYDEIWWFEGSIAQLLTIDLSSTTFDAYLELFDEDWHLLEEDDNSGGGTDAQISYLLTSTETYYIRVSSAVLEEYGDYLLSIAGTSPTYDYNEFFGVNIDNRYNGGTADVRITAPRGSYGLDIRDNNFTGMSVYSNGNLNFSEVMASYNGGSWGAYLENDFAEGKSVNLKDSSFSSNDELGLSLYSKGSITWSGGGANSNLSDRGAIIYNNSAARYKPVNISSAVFDDNYSSGLDVQSLGAITLNNVGASDNQNSHGARLNNCQYDSGFHGCLGYGNITVKGVFGSVNFNNNATFGLGANSRGNIIMLNVNASDNNGDNGMYLSNVYENTYGNITVSTSLKKTYSDLSRNGDNGLQASSKGTITLSNLNAWNNVHDGLSINNQSAVSPKSVTVMRVKCGENLNHGIWVSSAGAITIGSIEDFGNAANGVSLNNQAAAGPQNVTVTRTRIIGNTGGTGLYITSNGNVTLNNVITTGNQIGTWVKNAFGWNARVTVLGSMGESIFSNNTFDGLSIISSGDVSLNDVIAEWNGEDGIDVTIDGQLLVTNGWFYRNSGCGMYAEAESGATIRSLKSYNNGSALNGDGLTLVVNTGSLAKILNSVFTGNYGNGIELVGDPDPLLTGTFYFGNDINDTGDKNLRIH